MVDLTVSDNDEQPASAAMPGRRLRPDDLFSDDTLVMHKRQRVFAPRTTYAVAPQHRADNKGVSAESAIELDSDDSELELMDADDNHTRVYGEVGGLPCWMTPFLLSLVSIGAAKKFKPSKLPQSRRSR